MTDFGIFSLEDAEQIRTIIRRIMLEEGVLPGMQAPVYTPQNDAGMVYGVNHTGSFLEAGKIVQIMNWSSERFTT